MSDLVEVRMVTQMSGSRGDGSEWPAPGATLMVPKEEADALCHSVQGNPPIAVRVEKAKVEHADKPPAAETRPGPTEAETASAEPPAETAAEEAPVKRGPGRPPGSKNKTAT